MHSKREEQASQHREEATRHEQLAIQHRAEARQRGLLWQSEARERPESWQPLPETQPEWLGSNYFLVSILVCLYYYKCFKIPNVFR